MLRFVRIVSLATFVCAALLAGPASADPANKNAQVLTFDYLRSGARAYLTVVFVYIQGASGQIFYQVPGQLNRPDLWTCTIREFPGGIGKVFLTPRG